MRSMAQNRLTAVGRVREWSRRCSSNSAADSGLLHAQRDSHGGRHADGRRAPDDHGSNGFGNLQMIGASDVDFFAREARLIDHDHARIGPLYGFNHRVRDMRQESGELREIESGMHQCGGGGLSFVLGPAEDAAHQRDQQHILPGPFVFIAMNASEDESGEPRCRPPLPGCESAGASGIRGRPVPRHRAENDHHGSEQYSCAGEPSICWKGRSISGVAARLQQADRDGEQRTRPESRPRRR
jgi:hypothetical protein